MVQAVLHKTHAVDEALLYLATAMFKAMQNMLENSQPYALKEEEMEVWLKRPKCIVKTGTLTLTLGGMLSSLTDVWWVERPVPPQCK